MTKKLRTKLVQKDHDFPFHISNVIHTKERNKHFLRVWYVETENDHE